MRLGSSWRRMAWEHLPRPLFELYADQTILRLPDRVYMADILIPRIIERRPRTLLNVGVHYYTQNTQKTLERAGIEVFTADPDAHKVRWGARGRHRVCRAEDIGSHFPSTMFDCVLLNGVLGYGIDTNEEWVRTLQALAAQIPQGGLLVLGWDENMCADPLASGDYCASFVRDGQTLGTPRIARPNGLFDSEGRPAVKNFDLLRRI